MNSLAGLAAVNEISIIPLHTGFLRSLSPTPSGTASYSRGSSSVAVQCRLH